ncbi:MAG: C10 family peptidase [Agriterribacter sp.]
MKKTCQPNLLQYLFLLLLFAGAISCQKNGLQKVISSGAYKQIDLVPEDVAKTVAQKFDADKFLQGSNANSKSKNAIYRVSANKNNKIKNQFVFSDSSGYPAMYIFNYENDGGFLFVSADYKMQPILAFVEAGEFKQNDTVPPTFIEWANRTFENIEIVRKGLYDNTRGAKAAWDEYFKANNIDMRLSSIPSDPPCSDYSTTYTVGPLLTVTWGQACTYNDLCPASGCTNVCPGSPAAWTGCAATAMAQVIRYWAPTTTYAYNYASMPATFGNTEVQRLMRDLGLSANLNISYGCTGSSSFGTKIAPTFITNFGMAAANRITYTNGSTYNTVKSDIVASRPVILEGCCTKITNWLGVVTGYDNCHAWVCDGFREANFYFCLDGEQSGNTYLYFHMNWGWHETWGGSDYNGWFGVDNWNVSARSLNFQYARYAVVNIHP